jgi:hypothetical protein
MANMTIGLLLCFAHFTPAKLPKPKPIMNAATVSTTPNMLTPNCMDNMRAHSTSYARLVKPDRQYRIATAHHHDIQLEVFEFKRDIMVYGMKCWSGNRKLGDQATRARTLGRAERIAKLKFIWHKPGRRKIEDRCA